jgi:biotin carboxyl carrier protein
LHQRAFFLHGACIRLCNCLNSGAIPSFTCQLCATALRTSWLEPKHETPSPRPTRLARYRLHDPLIAVAAWQVLPTGRDNLTTVTVSRGTIESSVTALGTLQPRRYVDVGAQASGQIRQIHVEAGDPVQEGQLLVEIDPSTQKAKLDASRYAIENLKAQLQEQKAQHQLARQKYQRQQRLAAGNATREEDVQTAKAELSATQARVDMFQAQILQAQASLRSDEAELGYTRIYAPMSGTVVAVDARRPDPQRPAADPADPAHRQAVADDRVGRSLRGRHRPRQAGHDRLLHHPERRQPALDQHRAANPADPAQAPD